MSEYEKQVRDIAYRLWLQEGMPLGHDQRHWAEAERIAAQTAKGAGEQDKRIATDAAPVATEPRPRRHTQSTSRTNATE